MKTDRMFRLVSEDKWLSSVRKSQRGVALCNPRAEKSFWESEGRCPSEASDAPPCGRGAT